MLPNKLIEEVENLKKILSDKVKGINDSRGDVPTKTSQIEDAERAFRNRVLRAYKLAEVNHSECDHPFSEFSGEQKAYCAYCKGSLNSNGLYDHAVIRKVSFTTDF